MAVGFPAKTNFATGDVLTATNMNDITGTLNGLQESLYPAGRNKIINGDFTINQRGFTSTTTSNAYGFDGLAVTMVDGTVTYSAQTFTPGTAPVSGYEATNFARVVTTGQTLTTARANFRSNIENVRNFAGQTATISFWAKAATGTPKIAVEINQDFGSGGSPSTAVQTYTGQVTLSTSWARYSVTIAVPSISGKTIGTDQNSSKLQLNLFVSAGSTLNTRTGSLGIQSNTFDIWGLQFENGSTASPFQTASGSIGEELALCQRYYFRAGANSGGTTTAYSPYASGYISSATEANFIVKFPQTMRVNPTDIGFGNLAVSDSAGNFYTLGSIAYSGINTNGATIYCYGLSGMTANRPAALINNNNTAGYFYASSEL